MHSIDDEYLTEAKREEFWQYARLAASLQTPRDVAAVEVAVGITSNLPSHLDTFESMLQSALQGAGICCEAAADDFVDRYLRSDLKDLREVASFQEAWLTIEGSTDITDMLQAESGP